MTKEALSIELPVRPESARKARETVAEFRDQLDGPTHNDLRLVVSELVADAVRAEVDGSHRVRIRIEARDGRIRATVIEGALAYELKSRRPQLGEAGWGIYLARVLGLQWGTWHDAERGCVLIQMELSGSGA
jgi:anti-sigma regulatory factor (Ser/Thr protein kinase)